MISLVRWGALAGLMMASATPAGAGASRAVCFTARDNARLPFRVFQQSPPPEGANDRDYPAYPLTDATTMQLGAMAKAPASIGTWFFQWGNRSNAPLYGARGQLLPRKPNLQPSAAKLRKQRTPFTSLDRADACTLAQSAVVLGRRELAEGFAREAGIALVGEERQPDIGVEGPADTCVTAARAMPASAHGIVLDYEVADGRTPAQSLAFLQKWAGLVHGARRQAVLMIDPFDAPTQRYTGITAEIANQVVAAFDYTTLFLWGRNAQRDLPGSYRTQLGIVSAGGPLDGKRLLVLFDLNGTSLDDARFVRRAVVADKLAGVMFWRNRAVQGGGCDSDTNRKIAIIALGRDRAAALPAGRGE
jgi:hypothetical protein